MLTRRVLLGGTAAALALPAIVRAQGSKPEISSLVLGFGIDPPFAPHIVAMQKGWLKDAGFTDVKTQTFASGNLAGEALVGGQIHLWTPGNLPPIAMAANGIPITVLATNCVNWNLEKLVVRDDANVMKPEDLYNIRIGLIQGSTSSAFVYYMAERYKLDQSKLQLVNLPPPEQLAAFTSGDIKGLVCWEPWPYRALAAAKSRVVQSGLYSYFGGPKGEPAKVSNNRSLNVVSKDFLARNPNAARALLGVLVRAQKFVADPANKQESIRLFSEFQKQDPAMNTAIWDNYVFDPTFNEAYIDDMRKTTDYLLKAGRIRQNIDPLAYSNTALLKEIDPALVKIEGKA